VRVGEQAFECGTEMTHVKADRRRTTRTHPDVLVRNLSGHSFEFIAAWISA